MSSIKTVAASVILQKLIEHGLERRSPPGQKALRMLAGVLVLTALILLMIAGYRWLSVHFDPIEAPALAAAFVLAMGCVIWAIAASLAPRPVIPAQEIEHKVVQAAKDMFSNIEGDIGDSIKDHPRAAMSVAALIGFLLARRIL